MFKQKILSVLLALGAVALIPSVALAQTTSDDLFEDSSLTWETDWDYDYGDYSDLYEYTYDISDMATFMSVFGTLFAVWGVAFSIGGLAVYIYTSLAYMQIAKKLAHPNPWFAWVPVLRSIQKFQLAQMSGWFVLLLLVPGVNIVMSIIALMNICERRGMDKLLGLLALVPGASFVLIGVLAWKKDKVQEAPTE